MDFSVEFYRTQSGRSPVQDFLDDLKTKDPDDFAIILAGLAKLRQKDNHRPPLSKPIGEDLYELRHVGKLNTRVIYFFMIGRRIISVHGIRNKASKIPGSDFKTALSRKKDWEKRNSS
jgi:phage-related protein